MCSVEKRSQVSKTFFNHLELLKAQNMDKWSQLWAEDAVIEFPYAPPGSPLRLKGKQAIFNFFKDSFKYVKFLAWSDFQIYPMLAPDTIFVEFRGIGEVIETGRPYKQVYCGLLRMKDGKIAFYRKYLNPLIVQEAFSNANSLKRI